MVITESFRYDKNLLLSFSVLRFFRRDGNETLIGWLGGVDGDGVAKGVVRELRCSHHPPLHEVCLDRE